MYFQKRITALRIIGMWPLPGVNDAKFENLYTYGCIALLTNMTVMLILIFYAGIELARNKGKFDAEIFEHVSSVLVCFQGAFKLMVTAYKARHIQKLINVLNSHMESTFVFKQIHREILRKCKRYDLKLSTFFIGLSFMIWVSYTLGGLIVTLKRIQRVSANGTTVGALPVRYPFVLQANSFWFWFWYVQQVSANFFNGYTSGINDSLFCGIMYYLCGHFDILINNIKNVDVDVNFAYCGENEEDGYQKLGKKLVDQHHYLISYSKEVNQTFAPLIVLQLFLGAITIGLQLIKVFVVVVPEGFFAYAKTVLYLALKLFQLHIFTWHGQLILDKSLQVCEACYFSIWYENKPKSWLRNLKTIMIRSQKPLKVEAAGLFPLTTHTYREILNKSYAYFTLLNTLK